MIKDVAKEPEKRGIYVYDRGGGTSPAVLQFEDSPVHFRLRLRRDFCYTYHFRRLDCVFAVMRLISSRVA